MGRLHQLYQEFGQSPWLDNLKRGWITSGELKRWMERGVRGITSNPTIFAKAIEGSADYDDQFRKLVDERHTVEESYWELVKQDIEDALSTLRPLAEGSNGGDGFVSVEVAPTACPRHAGHRRGRPPVVAADRRAQPVRQDPGHRRRVAGDPPVPQ